MAQSKKSKAPDAACRINFMYQAAHALLLKQSLSIKDPQMKVEDLVRAQALRAVSSHITHMQVGVGLKAVLRQNKDMKRTVCKGCHIIQEAGKTCRIKTAGSRKSKRTVIRCLQCGEKRNFPLKVKKPK